MANTCLKAFELNQLRLMAGKKRVMDSCASLDPAHMILLLVHQINNQRAEPAATVVRTVKDTCCSGDCGTATHLCKLGESVLDGTSLIMISPNLVVLP